VTLNDERVNEDGANDALSSERIEGSSVVTKLAPALAAARTCVATMMVRIPALATPDVKGVVEYHDSIVRVCHLDPLTQLFSGPGHGPPPTFEPDHGFTVRCSRFTDCVSAIVSHCV
jgi:hypothetical protein